MHYPHDSGNSIVCPAAVPVPSLGPAAVMSEPLSSPLTRSIIFCLFWLRFQNAIAGKTQLRKFPHLVHVEERMVSTCCLYSAFKTQEVGGTLIGDDWLVAGAEWNQIHQTWGHSILSIIHYLLSQLRINSYLQWLPTPAKPRRRTSQTQTTHQPNPDDAGPIVRHPMRLTITAGCDIAWIWTRVSVVMPASLRSPIRV